jgi:hypothetical protein
LTTEIPREAVACPEKFSTALAEVGKTPAENEQSKRSFPRSSGKKKRLNGAVRDAIARKIAVVKKALEWSGSRCNRPQNSYG